MLREVDAGNIERSIRTLVGFGTRHSLSSQDDPQRGIGAARDWIFDQFQRYAADSDGRMTVAEQSFVQPPGPRNPQPVTVTNLVATLRGTQAESADRVYVVSGHYDSRCTDVLNFTCDAPGADDDASGVAAVLELARAMAKRPLDATIVFMAVAGEEQGLFGSTFFAQQAKQQGMDVEGMFTNDIIGSSVSDQGQRDPFTVRLFSEGVPTSETPQQAALRQSIGGENDGPSRRLARYVKEVAENSPTHMRVRLIWRRDRFLRGGDQIPFLQQGYPAARFTEPAENFAHQHQDVRVENGVQFGDLPQFVDFDYTARVARVNGAALWSLAMAPTAPKEAKILTARLINDTDLTWKADPEPDLAGYEVVRRESTDPLWTHTIPVGDVTSFTIEGLSKDNVQVGVRAVDHDGNRSPVSFPTPSS
jgi:Peptidase family M28